MPTAWPAKTWLKLIFYAGNPPVRICAGGTEKSVSLPRHPTADAVGSVLLDAGEGWLFPQVKGLELVILAMKQFQTREADGGRYRDVHHSKPER